MSAGQRIPGPKSHPWVQTIRYVLDPEGYLERLHRSYGDVFGIETVIFGREVCVCRPDVIKTVFTGDPDELRAGEANVALEPVLGTKSVLLLDGAEHLRQRRLLLPPFHGERMLAYAATMRDVTARVIDSWPTGKPFALHAQMQQITLEVILRTIFGVDRGPDLDRLARAITALLDRIANPVSMVATVPMFRRRVFGLSPWSMFLRIRKRADDAIYELIARRRNEPLRDDILSLLLAARDEEGKPMTDEELRDELMTLLVAGHETTATEIAWAFDRILRDERVLTKLRDEVDASPDLDQAPYLDATIKEVLRLSPVVPAVGRRIKRPMNVAGYDLPVDTLLVPVLWITHHLPDLYPRPHSFEPERFLGKKTDPYAWLPFGGGVRRCIGMSFALFEMKLVIGTILQRTVLRATSERPSRAVLRAFTHAPRGGVEVVLEGQRGSQGRAKRDSAEPKATYAHHTASPK